MNEKFRILFADDDEALTALAEKKLALKNTELTVARTGDMLKHHLKYGRFDLIISDRNFSSETDVSFLNRLGSLEIPLVIISGTESDTAFLNKLKFLPVDYLEKSAGFQPLVLTVKALQSVRGRRVAVINSSSTQSATIADYLLNMQMQPDVFTELYLKDLKALKIYDLVIIRHEGVQTEEGRVSGSKLTSLFYEQGQTILGTVAENNEIYKRDFLLKGAADVYNLRSDQPAFNRCILRLFES